MTELHLWLRHEARTTERRTPVVPDDARRLVEAGVELTVEDSPQRVFPAREYEAVGARIAPEGSWVSAPAEAVVLGLKELPDRPTELRHRHIFFGHAYKQQPGAADLLRRFAAGGGELLDLEYLVDDDGRRLAAFGFWAGYLGAALAVLQHRGRLTAPCAPPARTRWTRRCVRPPVTRSSPPSSSAPWAAAAGAHGPRSPRPEPNPPAGTWRRPVTWTAPPCWPTT